MPSPIPTVQPALSRVYTTPGDTSVNTWLSYMLGGVMAPGSIPRGGLKGFRRQTGFDKKAGKGTQGATLTLKTRPPCEGTITSQLFTAADFTAWDAFVAAVLTIDEGAQQADGLAIYYPAFSSIGLTVVVVEDWTPPEHMGEGLYHVTVKLCEWSQPPAASIVSTVASTSPDQDVGPGVHYLNSVQYDTLLTNQRNQAARAAQSVGAPPGGPAPSGQ